MVFNAVSSKPRLVQFICELVFGQQRGATPSKLGEHTDLVHCAVYHEYSAVVKYSTQFKCAQKMGV